MDFSYFLIAQRLAALCPCLNNDVASSRHMLTTCLDTTLSRYESDSLTMFVTHNWPPGTLGASHHPLAASSCNVAPGEHHMSFELCSVAEARLCSAVQGCNAPAAAFLTLLLTHNENSTSMSGNIFHRRSAKAVSSSSGSVTVAERTVVAEVAVEAAETSSFRTALRNSLAARLQSQFHYVAFYSLYIRAREGRAVRGRRAGSRSLNGSAMLFWYTDLSS